MPSIGDYLLNMMGRPDPRAMLAQAVAGGGGGTPAPAGMGAGGAIADPPPNGPGAPTEPGTRPGEIRRGSDGQNYQYAETTGMQGATGPQGWIQMSPEGSAFKSPNELFNLYTQLQDRQERNRQIDRGIGLMGASLAHPENRAGILQSFSGANVGNPSSMINSLIDFQTKSAELSQKAAQRASIPSIASKYGLDTTTALYLFDTGKLDSVIADLEKPDKQVVKGADGKDYIVDKSDGSVEDLGIPGPPREMEVVDGPDDSKVVIYKDTKLPVEGRGPLVPPEGNTEFEKNFRHAQKERPELTREQFRRETNRTTQADETYVDANGNAVGDPPKDMTWDMGPDGKVKVDDRGAPIAVPIGGTEIYLKNKEAAKEAEEAAKVAAGQKGIKKQTADIVTEDIDRALDIIDKSKDNWVPATGYGGLTAQVPLTPAYNVEEILKTVRANVGFDKLQTMRQASPTGAALGPVSDFENQLLQATLGNLNLAQDPNVVRYNLQRIKRIYSGVIHGEFVNKDGTPNQAAVDKALTEASKDIPLEDLLKTYGGTDGD